MLCNVSHEKVIEIVESGSNLFKGLMDQHRDPFSASLHFPEISVWLLSPL